MIRERAEIAVLGAGFAGSLMAMLLHRQGRRVVLLERGSHPRFSLGESSTPLANLALEEIAREYDLPWLADLAEYGKWKRTHPHLVCGLKRGFTFVDHRSPPDPGHANELLVTASPADEVADTHWLRADFDAYLVERAVEIGVPYIDRVDLKLARGQGWRLDGWRDDGEPVAVRADFLIDATGPTGALAKYLGIDTSPDGMHTYSWSVYSHFAGVRRWEDVSRDLGARVDEHPYRCDDAALHHVLDGGWVWVLRFDNGVTSAGVLLDDARPADTSLSPEDEWHSILSRYPNVARQFAGAEPTRPFVRTGRIQRKARETVGPDWAMLGPSAYTLDALYSTGNGHAIQTVRRLARVLERGWDGDLEVGLQRYQETLFREIDFLDRMVAATYRSYRHFSLLASFAMYYFAGAITAEERRKQGLASEDEEFLHSHDPAFRSAVERGCCAVSHLSSQGTPDVEGFRDFVAREIAPWNTVGLCDPRKRNLYPYG